MSQTLRYLFVRASLLSLLLLEGSNTQESYEPCISLGIHHILIQQFELYAVIQKQRRGRSKLVVGLREGKIAKL